MSLTYEKMNHTWKTKTLANLIELFSTLSYLLPFSVVTMFHISFPYSWLAPNDRSQCRQMASGNSFQIRLQDPLPHCRYCSLLQLLAPNDHQVFTHLTLLLQRIIHELSKYSFVCSFQLFLQFPCFLCYLITYTLEFHKFSSQHCFSLISTF